MVYSPISIEWKIIRMLLDSLIPHLMLNKKSNESPTMKDGQTGSILEKILNINKNRHSML